MKVRTFVALPLLALMPVARAADDLTDLSLESLLETQVTSASKYEQTLAEVPAAVSVITRDDIRAHGWRTLAQVLSSLPGIHTIYDRQYTYLGARGFGLPGDFNTRVLLAINGNRLNNVVYDSAEIGRTFPLELDLIERIEFIPGPGGAVYGQNAMFGVINVITRNGLQVDGAELVTSWLEPLQEHEASLRWGRRLDNDVDVLVSVSLMKSKGEDLFLRFPDAAGRFGDITGVAYGMDGEEDREFYAHAGRGPWTADVMYDTRSKEDPTAVYFSDPLVPGQYQRDDHLVSQLQYQQDFGDTWNVQGRLFTGRESYTGYFTYKGIGNFGTGLSEWYGTELRVLYTGYAGHKLMLGTELQDNSRADQSADDYSIDPLALGPRLVGSGFDILILRDGYRAGIYAQDEWAISDAVTTSLGLRVDHNDITGTELSPRAALIWRPAAATTLKALYGRAQRAPNTYERDYGDGISQIANPRLDGESIETLELLADQQLSRTLTVRGSLYRWFMYDLVTLGTEPFSGVPQYQSGGKMNAWGAELSANAVWNSGGRLRTSLTWQNAEDLSGARLVNSPQWLGRLNYSRPLAATGVHLGLEMQYDGKRKAIDGAMLDGYWLTNVNLRADTWVTGLEVSLALLNLFDESYEHPASDSNWQNTLEQDGRAVRLRLDYRF